MKITVKGRTREVTALEFISSCNRRGTAIKRDWFRLSCADERARVLLDASPELEAAVLLELSGADGEIRDSLAEREAILWVEGLPRSAMDAARVMTGR